MKKLFLIICFTLYGFTAFPQQRLAIAVAPFDAMGVTADEAKIVTNLLMADLASSGTLNVINPTTLDTVFMNMKFQNYDWLNSQKIIQLGQEVKARYVIHGQFLKLGESYTLTLTMVNIDTEKMFKLDFNPARRSEDIFPKIRELSAGIRSRIRYSIGDKGPGGGIIYYVADGDLASYDRQYRECIALSGKYTYSKAQELASNYRGGGCTDWQLPFYAMGLIDGVRIKKLDKNYHVDFKEDLYWLSVSIDGFRAFGFNRDDYPHINENEKLGVCLVRYFNYHF